MMRKEKKASDNPFILLVLLNTLRSFFEPAAFTVCIYRKYMKKRHPWPVIRDGWCLRKFMTKSNLPGPEIFLTQIGGLITQGWPVKKEYGLLLSPYLQERQEKARIVWSLRHPGMKMSVGDLVVLGLWRCVIRCSVSTLRLNSNLCSKKIVIYTLIRHVLIFRERKSSSSLDRPTDPTSE